MAIHPRGDGGHGPAGSRAADAAPHACLLTHEKYEAGPLVQLHGVGLVELEHWPRVPGKEPALRVVQHLDAALPCDHVTLRVQQNQGGDTCGGRGEQKGGDDVREWEAKFWGYFY